jgi:tRNA U55 pseudouridine synthase TruB
VGSAAYLGALRRTAAGRFAEADAVSLDDVRAAVADGPAGLVPLLRPIDDGLDRFPVVELTAAEVDAVAHGQYVKPDAGIAGVADHYRLRGPDGALVAIAVPGPGGRLTPDKVLIPAPAAPAGSAAATAARPPAEIGA